MTNLELRVFRLEKEIVDFKNLIVALQNQVGKLAQDAWMAQQGGGGGGGGAAPLFCITTGALAASGTIGSGTPTHITGQTIYRISGGAFVSVTTSGDLYNGHANAVPSGSATMVESNADGTYSIIAVASP